MSGGLIGQASATDADTGPTTTADSVEQSHLDSFFEGSGWTREDVMVVAAGIQILMWISLLWIEARRGS